MTEAVRLDKHLASLLACPRRDAENYIENGWVRVDGVVVEEPQFKVSTQTVELDPQAELAPAEPASMLLHKPAGVDADAPYNSAAPLLLPELRSRLDNTGVRMLKRHFLHQASVLPLDTEASGMIVLTQDRQLARRLWDDRDRYEQEFLVEVSGSLGAGGLERMNNAHGIRQRPPHALKVSWQNETRLRIAAKAVQPGQIRQLCEAAGLGIVAIKRLRIGRIPMARIVPGEWRYLASYERV